MRRIISYHWSNGLARSLATSLYIAKCAVSSYVLIASSYLPNVVVSRSKEGIRSNSECMEVLMVVTAIFEVSRSLIAAELKACLI